MFPGELKQRLENVFLDLTKKLDNPEFVHSITTFVESYESIQTDDELASALSSFGQRLWTGQRLQKTGTSAGLWSNSSTAGHHIESYLSGWGLVSKPPRKCWYRRTCARKTDVLSAALTQCVCAMKETCSQSKLSPILAPQALYPPSPFEVIVLRNVSTCCIHVAHAI